MPDFNAQDAATQDGDVRAMFDLMLAGEPPLRTGPDRVYARARRIQVRDRLAFSVAGVGTVAALAAAVVAASGGAPADRPGVSVLGPGAGPSTGSSTDPTATPEGAPSGGADGMRTDLLPVLTSLLPAGFTTTDGRSQAGYAGVVAVDGKGRGLVEINVQPFAVWGSGVKAEPGAAPLDDCAAWPVRAGGTCDTEVLADGSKVLTAEGPNMDGTHAGVSERLIQVILPSGVRIVVAEWNATDTHRGAATRPAVPLSAAQLRAIALSPLWTE